VSCMCVRDFQLFRWWIAAFLLLWIALMRHSEVELWTAEMSFQYNVRLMNNIHLWIFCFRMNTFVKTFILFTKRDVIASTITDGTFFVIHPWSTIFLICNLVNDHSSAGRRRLPHQDCSWNSESWLTTFRVISEKLYNIVNYNNWLLIILLLWQPIAICDYPSIPKTVTTFYPLQRTDTYPTCIFYHSNTLPKLLLKTSNCLNH